MDDEIRLRDDQLQVLRILCSQFAFATIEFSSLSLQELDTDLAALFKAMGAATNKVSGFHMFFID
jgi:hypothetical protein